MENNKLSFVIKCILVVQVVCYFTFICMDLFFQLSVVSSVIKYATIVLCLCLTVIFIWKEGITIDRLIVLLAMIFTCIADVFLLFTNKFVYGVLSFFIVQILYLIRCALLEQPVNRMRERTLRIKHKSFAFQILLHVMNRLYLIGIGVLVMVIFRVPMDSLLLVTLAYASFLICNLVYAVKLARIRYWDTKPVFLSLFAIGLLLLLLCDIQVGFNNLSSYVTLSGSFNRILISIVGVGMWACYLPSQILIVCSTKERQP